MADRTQDHSTAKSSLANITGVYETDPGVGEATKAKPDPADTLCKKLLTSQPGAVDAQLQQKLRQSPLHSWEVVHDKQEPG